MGPTLYPIFDATPLPHDCNTVVIGGGIIGVCAALYLRELGQEVVLIEKGHIAGEQSSRNWGWCRQGRRDPREFDLVRESLRLWRGMNELIGADTGFATCGSFFAARDEATVERYTSWTRDAAQAGINGRMLSEDHIAQLLRGDTSPPGAGLYCESDGRAEPQVAVPQMAKAAQERGVQIRTDCAARGIEMAGGNVTTVVTERGVVRCNSVVIAGGVWTRQILRDLNVHIPQLQVRATVSRTQPVSGGPDICFWDGVLGVRRRADGGFTLANGMSNTAPITPDSFRFMVDYLPLLAMEWRHLSLTLGQDFLREWKNAGPVPLDQPSRYEACRILDPSPDRRFVKKSLAEFRRRFPSLEDVRISQVWAGMIDAMPDTVPIISEVPGISGLVVATGFSGHGFGAGPGAGHLVADMVSGRKPIVSPHEFRIERFTDGSKPRPIVGV